MNSTTDAISLRTVEIESIFLTFCRNLDLVVNRIETQTTKASCMTKEVKKQKAAQKLERQLTDNMDYKNKFLMSACGVVRTPLFVSLSLFYSLVLSLALNVTIIEADCAAYLRASTSTNTLRSIRIEHLVHL